MSGELVTDIPNIALNDLLHAKEMAEVLHQHYPGWLWGVHVDGHQGMADVRNLSLSGNWGYRLHLDKMFTISDFRARVVRAGGEILERYDMARRKIDPDAWASLPTNFAGAILGDMSKG